MKTQTPRHDPERVIRASEVGAHSYCARAWWLGAVEGVRRDDVRPLRAGWTVHEQHGRRVMLSAILTRLFYALLILAGMAGLGWLISSFLG